MNIVLFFKQSFDFPVHLFQVHFNDDDVLCALGQFKNLFFRERPWSVDFNIAYLLAFFSDFENGFDDRSDRRTIGDYDSVCIITELFEYGGYFVPVV